MQLPSPQKVFPPENLQTPSRRQKMVTHTKTSLESMEKEQLIQIILKNQQSSRSLRQKLNRLNHQKNIINTSRHSRPQLEDFFSPPKKKSKTREMNWSIQQGRSIAFWLAYNGKSYKGNTYNPDMANETVEGFVFRALLELCLTPSIQHLQFQRSGRTDCGVNARQQICSCVVRSKYFKGIDLENVEKVQFDDSSDSDEKSCTTSTTSTTSSLTKYPKSMGLWPKSYFNSPAKLPFYKLFYQSKWDNLSDQRPPFSAVPNEFPYVAMLNKRLPSDIRVLGWCAVPHNFSARFSCISRTYRYYFLKDSLDIPLMQKAAKKYLGNHNFKNFCKINPQTALYIRTILISEIVSEPSVSNNVFYFQVRSPGFLWHMVRALIAVLFLIGSKREPITVIDDLFHLEKYPQRPLYSFAPPYPLVLYSCEYVPSLNFQSSSSDFHQTIDMFRTCHAEFVTAIFWNDLLKSWKFIVKNSKNIVIAPEKQIENSCASLNYPLKTKEYVPIHSLPLAEFGPHTEASGPKVVTYQVDPLDFDIKELLRFFSGEESSLKDASNYLNETVDDVNEE